LRIQDREPIALTVFDYLFAFLLKNVSVGEMRRQPDKTEPMAHAMPEA
jgi:hypothetical protein